MHGHHVLTLDVVARQRAAVLELLPLEVQAVLALMEVVLHPYVHLDDDYAPAGLHVHRDGLARQGLHEEQYALVPLQQECGLVLDVVVRQRAVLLQVGLEVAAGEALLCRRDARLVLKLCLDGINGVAGLYVQGGDGLALQGLPSQRSAWAPLPWLETNTKKTKI